MQNKVTLNFNGDIGNLMEGINILTDFYDFELSMSGTSVKLQKYSNSNIEIYVENKIIYICYNKKIHFFRALGHVLEKTKKGISNFKITELPKFDMIGISLDCSRNAVPKVETIKLFLMRMAVMGITTLILYMEDTYEVPGEPYFGYMRGRYTYDELKEINDYAQIFGIEVMPSIQTLGHMEQVLKWDIYSNVRDTGDILLVGEKKTYELLDKMIKSASSPFMSRKICIGMDEAYNIGLGRYLKIHGYTDKYKIMSDHLDKVASICENNDLKIYMAGDMYFSMASNGYDYYEDNIKMTDEIIQKVPKNITLAYWDYIHEDEKTYKRMLKLHKQLSNNVCFVGGTWCWTGMGVHYRKSLSASDVALKVCKEEGVREVIMATFGNNGSEGNYMGVMLGMQQYAEHAYTKEVDRDRLAERFYYCTGGNMDDFVKLSGIDDLVIPRCGQLRPYNPAKYLLYQDVILGLFDRCIKDIDVTGYYKKLTLELNRISENINDATRLFNLHSKASSVLEIKGDLSLRIREMYTNQDYKGLHLIIEKDIPELKKRVENMRIAHRKLWMSEYKPFGWEVIDIRYGGLLARIDSAAYRISELLNGNEEKIEELEEQRLPMYNTLQTNNSDSNMILFNSYIRIVTTGVF